MWKKNIPTQNKRGNNHQHDDFEDLLSYMTTLADNKLGYPVSLLTYIGVLDNSVLGIEQNSLANVLLNNVGDPFKDSETSLMEVKKHERLLIAILARFYGMHEDDIRGYVTTGGTEGNCASLWWSKRYLINMALDSLLKVDNIIKSQLKEEQELTALLAKIPLNDYAARANQLQKIVDIKNTIAENKNLVQQLLTPTVFYTKNHTHYSIPKIAEILRLNIRPVEPNEDGSMNLANLKKEILLHLGAHPQSSVVVIANIGTTITGAIDDVPGIKAILDAAQPKPTYTIHLDGALTGFVMPILKPFGEVPNYFSALGVNTLAVSAHKYPGLSQPCGIILATRHFFEKAFEKSERSVDYVGNIMDVTITGSRSGLNVLMFYHALKTLGLDKGNDILTAMVNENMERAIYLYDELVKIFGKDKVFRPYHFNVMFPKPSKELAKKYQLMLTGERATICVLTNVSNELIDAFIKDLKLELLANTANEVQESQPTTGNNALEVNKEKVMQNKLICTDFNIQTLKKEHIAATVDLFTRSFCDSEPITRHLHINYRDYTPFAKEVVEKAVQDGMSVVAVNEKGKVIACAIAEDITNPFQPHPENYPKMKPILALLDELSKPFLQGKRFLKGKIAHVWIAIVDPDYRGHGLSTAIDIACGELVAHNGYDFAYAEFTNEVSEKITHHYAVHQLCNSIEYDNFKWEANCPFKGIKGQAAAYLVGIKPGIQLDSLRKCYKTAA